MVQGLKENLPICTHSSELLEPPRRGMVGPRRKLEELGP